LTSETNNLDLLETIRILNEDLNAKIDQLGNADEQLSNYEALKKKVF
jgi:hypothetical protein